VRRAVGFHDGSETPEPVMLLFWVQAWASRLLADGVQFDEVDAGVERCGDWL
jgi:hypothetical protein